MERDIARSFVRERRDIETRINQQQSRKEVEVKTGEEGRRMRKQRFDRLGERFRVLNPPKVGIATYGSGVDFVESAPGVGDEVSLYIEGKTSFPVSHLVTIRAVWSANGQPNIEEEVALHEIEELADLSKITETDRKLGLLEDSFDAMQNQIAYLHSAAELQIS